MVLQCPELFDYKVSSEFLREDVQSSYSFGKIQNVGETELYEERIQRFIGERFQILFSYIFYSQVTATGLEPRTTQFMNEHSTIWPNCMSSASLIGEIHQKLCNRKGLSTGEPCICEYVTLLQSFHGCILSVHWYLGHNFQSTFFMFVLFRRSSKTTIFSSLLNGHIATSNFMNEFYDGGFASEFSASVLKENIALVGDYLFETRK